MLCSADPAGGHYQEFSPLKVLYVFCKHSIEVVNLGLQGSSWQPEEDDPLMGEPLVKNQLAKIPISNNQDPLLIPRNSQHIIIGKAMRIIAGDRNDIVVAFTKVGNESKVSALIEEEFHKAASERTPLGGLGETSLPVTISLA
jgi:hypothetical protein